jgi:hypothetical protein
LDSDKRHSALRSSEAQFSGTQSAVPLPRRIPSSTLTYLATRSPGASLAALLRRNVRSMGSAIRPSVDSDPHRWRQAPFAPSQTSKEEGSAARSLIDRRPARSLLARRGAAGGAGAPRPIGHPLAVDCRVMGRQSSCENDPQAEVGCSGLLATATRMSYAHNSLTQRLLLLIVRDDLFCCQRNHGVRPRPDKRGPRNV